MAKAKKGRYTVLLFFLIIFPTSCNYEILGSTGVPSLQRSSIDSYMDAYRVSPPKTEKEMIKLLHHKPLGTYRSGKMKYSYWGWYEINPYDQHFSSLAACISVGGKIQQSAIKRATIWGTEKVYGEPSVFDFEKHPGMLKASLPFFRMQSKCTADHLKRPLYMSPSGKSAYILGEGEKFLGWNGETPRIATKAPSSTRSGGNLSEQIGAIFVNTLISSIAANRSVSSTPAPDPATIEGNRQRNQEVIDYWKRKEEKARDDYYYYHDLHFGKGGFDTW